jgi:hypothetical protein
MHNIFMNDIFDNRGNKINYNKYIYIIIPIHLFFHFINIYLIDIKTTPYKHMSRNSNTIYDGVTRSKSVFKA